MMDDRGEGNYPKETGRLSISAIRILVAMRLSAFHAMYMDSIDVYKNDEPEDQKGSGYAIPEHIHANRKGVETTESNEFYRR